MNAMQSIVGIYKAKCGMRFDREVAEALGMKEQTLNNYMKGRSKLPDIAIAKIAEGAQLDAMQVIAATNLTSGYFFELAGLRPAPSSLRIRSLKHKKGRRARRHH